MVYGEPKGKGLRPDYSGVWVLAITGAGGARRVERDPLGLTRRHHVLDAIPNYILAEVVAGLQGALQNSVDWVGLPVEGAQVFLKGSWPFGPREEVDERGGVFGF